jgi:hypothetical protein
MKADSLSKDSSPGIMRRIGLLLVPIHLFLLLANVTVWLKRKEETKPVSDVELTRKRDGQVTSGLDPTDSQVAAAKARTKQAIALTPAIARSRLADIEKISDLEARKMAHYELFRDLCVHGFAEEAWQMISEEPGEIRAIEIHAFFQNAKLSEEAMREKMQTLIDTGYSKEVGSAFMSYLNRHNISDMRSLLESGELGKTVDLVQSKGNRPTGSLLKAYFGLILRDPERAAESGEALQLMSQVKSQGWMSDDEFSMVISSAIGIDPFSKWKLSLESQVENKSEPAYTDGIGNVIRSMVQSNPLQAVTDVIAHQNEKFAFDSTRIAFAEWAQQDPRGAAGWYEQNKDRLNAEQRDGVATAFFAEALENRELDVARSWAEETQNPAIREKMAKELPALAE